MFEYWLSETNPIKVHSRCNLFIELFIEFSYLLFNTLTEMALERLGRPLILLGGEEPQSIPIPMAAQEGKETVPNGTKLKGF
jgi:hypothetical protein